MIWETYRNEFNRNKLKRSETETVIPREDLTEPTPTAPVAIQAYSPCSARGLRRVKQSDFKSNISFKTERYVLKPFCVYSSLLLRCFIDHNISVGKHIQSKKQENFLDDCLRDITHAAPEASETK